VLHLPVGECVTLRPIRPRDAGILQAYVRGLSPDSRHHRFFGALNELPPTELDRVIDLEVLTASGRRRTEETGHERH
jgi:hypothetical protein